MTGSSRRIAALGFAALGLATFPNGSAAQTRACPEAGEWRALTQAHLARYRAMELADLYKLLHQATMGAEHAVAFGDARAWLEREMASLGSGPTEPTIDPLGSGDGLVRVHLRPFFEEGGDPEALLEAFVATARVRPTSVEALECALTELRRLGREGALPWPSASVDRFVSERAAAGYPAIEHSVSYRERYRPAYRVVATDFLGRLAGR